MKTNWKSWTKAALIRAVRTFAEAALAYIGTGAVVLGDVNWLAALSAGGFGFVTAILLALTGLPETDMPAPECGEKVSDKQSVLYTGSQIH